MRILDEFESKRILAGQGIPVIEEERAHTEDEAIEAARRLGFPVALKVCSGHVAHKTEKGGVVLDIADEESLRHHSQAMRSRFRDVEHSLLVQRMAPRGVELILGAKRDPVFGPVVLAGMGGVLAELIQDTSLELAPMTRRQARAMLERLQAWPVLKGFRGSPGVDVDCIVDAIVALARLVSQRSDIMEADINPIIAHPGGAVAVDALVRIDDSASGRIRSPRPGPQSVDPFFNPRSFALLGASRSHGKGGNIILRNVLKAGFTGAVYPINPTGHEILGLPSHKRVTDIPGEVDLAMIVIPKPAVESAVRECAAKGVKALIVCTGGYADAGSDGAKGQARLVEIARAHGMRLMGPNSIGVINPDRGLATSIVGLEPIMKGGVALIGQSGVFSSGWGRWIADTRPFGISKIACIGNKADIDESDLLEYLAEDGDTTAIGIYLEGVVHGGRFVKAAARASRRKPVVVLKSGRTEAGAMAIASHTGSLAGSDTVFDAVCRRTGLVRVHDSEAFFDTLSAFESLPLPQSNRLGVLSITGMGCVVATDACEEYGLRLPDLRRATVRKLREVIPPWAPVRNPIDIWSAVEQHGSAATMRHIAACLLDQTDIDALLMIFVLMPESIFDIKEAFADILKAHPRKPVLVAAYGGTRRETAHVQEGFRALGVPFYPTPERAIFALSRMVAYARFRRGRGNGMSKERTVGG